jgi:hypothetical protein
MESLESTPMYRKAMKALQKNSLDEREMIERAQLVTKKKSKKKLEEAYNRSQRNIAYHKHTGNLDLAFLNLYESLVYLYEENKKLKEKK